ncbi:MAG: hypothetical protein WAW42_09310 [Candidatus Competibacteraceae bacterium]
MDDVTAVRRGAAVTVHQIEQEMNKFAAIGQGGVLHQLVVGIVQIIVDAPQELQTQRSIAFHQRFHYLLVNEANAAGPERLGTESAALAEQYPSIAQSFAGVADLQQHGIAFNIDLAHGGRAGDDAIDTVAGFSGAKNRFTSTITPAFSGLGEELHFLFSQNTPFVVLTHRAFEAVGARHRLTSLDHHSIPPSAIFFIMRVKGLSGDIAGQKAPGIDGHHWI